MQPPHPGDVRKLKLAIIAATALIAAGIVVLAWPRPRGPVPPEEMTAQAAASVSRLQGPVTAGFGEDRQALLEGATLYLGEAIDTGVGASLSLQTSVGKATLELGPETSFTLAGRGQVRVTRGRLGVNVPASLMLAVTTPHGQVVGRQSKFAITTLAHASSVEVTEGDALLVRTDGTREMVKAGAKAILGGAARAAAPDAGR